MQLLNNLVNRVVKEVEEYLPVWTGAMQSIGVLALIGFGAGLVPGVALVVPVTLISVVQHVLVEQAYGY